jgi:hypothetical protein
LASAAAPASLTAAGNAKEQPAFPRPLSTIPFDAHSTLMMEFTQFTQSVQGIVATTPAGELFDVGNSDGNTVEASIIVRGVDLTSNLMVALPQTVVGGGKGMATIIVGEDGTTLAAGPLTVDLFASGSPYLATGQTPFQSFVEKLKLKPGKARILHIKFKYPASLSKGYNYLVASVAAGSTPDLNLANNTSASGSSVLIVPPFVHLVGSGLTAPVFTGTKAAAVPFTITNVGNVTASAVSAAQFLASNNGTPIGAIPLPAVPLRLNLKPGSAHMFKVKLALPAMLPAATYTLVAIIDPANVFNDPNFTTNFIVSGNTFVVP